MNIIYLCPEMLLPANTGGRIVCYKRLEYLAKGNDIHLFCITDKDSDAQYLPELENMCKKVHLYNRSKHKLNALKNSFKYPYACASRTLPQLRKDVEIIFYKENIDFVIVDFPQMLMNISPQIMKSGKVILGQHNIEYVTMNNISKSLDNPIKKFIYCIEAKRMESFEKKIYEANQVRLYTFVSSDDKAFFEKTFRMKNTLHVPVGCEVQPYGKANGAYYIMYFGKMAYPANAEAACDFSNNVFLEILKTLPEAKLYIVGKDPLPKVKQLGERFGNNIVITGTVDSVEPYYEKASVVVVPLRHGGGVKVKVLEALGHGKLIITTRKGIEGTDFIADKHLVVANDDADFANKCIGVLTNPNSYENIRKGGYEYVKDNYTWQAIIEAFEQTLIKLKQETI